MVTAAEPVAGVEGAVVSRAPDEKVRLPVEAPSRVVACVSIEGFASMSGWTPSRAREAWTCGGGPAGRRPRPDSGARSWSRSRRAREARPRTRTVHVAEVGNPERRAWDTVTVGRSGGIASACFGAASGT